MGFASPRAQHRSITSLAAALHLGVVALHGGEIEVRIALARRHAGRGAAAETDQHGGTAEHHQLRAHRHVGGLDMLPGDGAQATGDHHRLVIAPGLAVPVARRLEGTEVARKAGPAVLVVEGRRAEGPVQHDLLRRGDPGGFAGADFPRFERRPEFQVTGGEADQARLRLRAATHGALVADLAARARGRARIGSDGRGMVVGLHLHEYMGRSLLRLVDVLGIREETGDRVTLDHRRVVRVGGENPGAVDALVGIPDHREQGLRLRLAIDLPVGVEDLMPAVFRVGLGEHHQLDVRGVPAELGERPGEVGDLVGGQREAQVLVRVAKRGQGIVTERDVSHGPWNRRAGQAIEVAVVDDRLGHPVVQDALE